MPKIEEIFKKESQTDIISELKLRRGTSQPDVGTAIKQLDPKEHDVMDPIIRPDKKVRVDRTDTSNTINVTGIDNDTETRTEKVARVAVAIQRLIVKRAVAFLFGNDVALNGEPQNDQEKVVFTAIEKILKDNKSKSFNRKIARNVFSCQEAAEVWYPIEQPGYTRYGFPSKFKLRCSILSPLLGDTLYPYFDENGDMTAFSREYQQTDESKINHTYFETYTDAFHYLWVMTQEGWTMVEGYPKPIEIGKIPVVYAHQEALEWQDVQGLIDRLEKLLSNFSDTNDYHAAPKIFTTGEIYGFSKKGETGALIEGEPGATAQYLAWANAPESVKLEIATLLNLIYTLTQTPDISFDSVKGLSATSGIALKLLFMDAHLKVEDKQEIFDEYMQRRINLLKSFISKLSTGLAVACESLDIEPEITPYMIDDDMAKITLLVTANGNKPLISQKLSAKLSGLSQDPEADFTQIEDESTKANTFIMGQPAV